MMVHGYCETCHKIKRVRVSGSALIRGGVALGECDQCVEDREAKAKARRL